MKKILLPSIFVICLAAAGCKSSAKSHEVELVDRNAVFAFDTELHSLMLVVSISEDGKLSLNKIETGTISDTAELSEKLKAIFEDRKKAGIDTTEVVIDPQGKVGSEDLEMLIESLADAKASPIRMINTDH